MARKKDKKRRSLLLLVLFFVGTGLFLAYRGNLSAEIIIPESATVNSDDDQWWDSNYAYRRKIKLASSLTEQGFKLNHAALVVDGKANANGSDLKIIGQKNNDFVEVPFQAGGLDSTNAELVFDPTKFKLDLFYLYYGNKFPTTEGSDTPEVLGLTTDNSSTSKAELGIEESPELVVTSLKKWVLKEHASESLFLRVNSKKNLDTSAIFYVVVDETRDQKEKVTLTEGSIKYDPSQLKVGVHQLYIIMQSPDGIVRSNTITFYYTAPIYVAWTVDWEGSVPEQKYVDLMGAVSDDYVIPITHFFNPRLYIYLRASEVRKKELSTWVAQRLEKKGDDIALHIHMQHDLVEEAGVTAKYNNTGWDNGTSGYDIPSTAYSYNDILKIIKWGKNELEEGMQKYANFELPELQGYRAGGWFANLDTLKAIQEAGFIYDSSGREAFPIGQNKVTQPWDLKNTSQPYFPNATDQNQTNTPTLNILEVPNNGADSYWSDAKALLANFYANYDPTKLPETDKLIVYLSHPDWFYIDDPKLRELFDVIKRFRNDYDLGPVKFVTLRDYLKSSTYINSLPSTTQK